MNIYPAIDIIDGKCVRLTEGDYDQKTIYADDPVQMAKQFQETGMTYLHVVDLDGAKSGIAENSRLIKNIVQNCELKVEVGGGIRDIETVKDYLDTGADRVILGSRAVKDPEFLQTCLDQFGAEKIVFGLDLKDQKVAVSGWQEVEEIPVEEFLANYQGKHVLVTDVAKDGRLEGPNFSLYINLMQAFPDLNFIASGGVARLEDIQKLQEIGIQDVIVGKAIYEGKITLSDLA